MQIIGHHSMGYLPALISVSLPQASPEELDGKEDAAYGDDDENGRFWDGDRPDVGHPVNDTVTHMDNSKIEQHDTGKPADDGHDTDRDSASFFH